ncbi:MAG: putative metal-binding motif-containing protein, partial [Candidatus Woesearchaeota archaeon]
TKFNSVKELYLENKDLFEITNTSLKTYINLDSMDIDCFVLKSNTSLEFDVRINNRTNFSNVYITQRKINPLTMPFNYSNPICNLGCDNPNNCAKPTAFFNLLEGCSPEKCLFDCGGFWNNQSSFFDILWPKSYLNDYCENCRENMTCSNYSNEFSCVFDPCKASDTQLGCKWNGTSCLDAFKPCIPGTTLCADGSCSSNCRRTDYKEQGCINKNGICEKGEGCACEDCENKQDSCTEGAVCSAGVCSCPINTMLCNDNTCDETCENNGGVKGCINNNNICELGEGCGCSDCNEQRDSCVLNAKCNYALSKCISSEKTQCDEGTALCNDNTCDATCEEHGGFKGCIIKNNVCEDGEGCACEDCYGKQDTCKDGLICNNNICKKESNLNNENCIDNDKDGFFKMDSKCINGNDCDDNNKFINPNMVEVCGNDIDENCDGIKENCNYEQISLELLSDKSIEVLETARIKLKLINNIEKDFKNLNLKLKTPEKINTNRNIFLGELKSKDIREVIIPLVVKDYLNEEAEIVLSVTDGDNELIQDTITLTIIIPEFKIKPMPESEIENNNKICYDFYYIVNKEEGYYDIELDINNPSTIFGKSLVVDYMSNIYINGKTIQPLLGNPYCLSMDKVYEVSGYLYAPGVFKLTNKVDESKYELIN